MKRYENRKPDIIYIHMLDDTIYNTLSKRDNHISNEMIVGEIVHQGAERVLDDVDARCREIKINLERVIPPAIERFVKYDSKNEPFVIVCGKADGFYNGYPVELKTTRSNNKPKQPNKEWIRRGKLYAWLYGVEKGYVVVFNVITAEEENYELPAYTDDEMKDIVEKWLRGEFPSFTLQNYSSNS